MMNSIKYLLYNSEKYERTVQGDGASLCLLSQWCTVTPSILLGYFKAIAIPIYVYLRPCLCTHRPICFLTILPIY